VAGPLIWQNRKMNISTFKIKTHVFLLFGLLALDQILKTWARNAGFATFHHGVFLGSELPLDSLNLNLAIVTSSILFLFLYFLLLIQLPKKIAASRLGLTLLTMGIVGNGIDRLLANKVTNIFVSMNLADLSFWAGLILFLYLFIKDRFFSKHQNNRSNMLILPKDQVRLSLIFSLLVLAAGLILGIFGAMFLNIHFVDYQLNGHLLLKKYIFLHIGVTFALSLMFFIFCIFFSHKLAGPVFGFLNYLKRNDGVMKGEFRSRDRDFFHALEDFDREIAANKKS
jgi:lipoprotein signal peptidase